MDQKPVFSAAFHKEGVSPEELRLYIEKKVKPAYARIKGVGEIQLIGGSPLEIHVEIDQLRASAGGFTAAAAAALIQAANIYTPAGELEEGSLDTALAIEGRLKTVDDLRELPAAGNIRLSQIADVKTAYRLPDDISRTGQKQCVSLQVKSSSPRLIPICRQLRKTTADVTGPELEADIVL